MGGDLKGTGGRSPQKFEVGETAHASVSPIFQEVVLLKACKSCKREKKGGKGEIF